ncbi:7-carboxy-7-deazaguanine synthase [Xylophilus rhododendri]|uniref:7-carboxy-7-deazaguanine synthase n=1 Tax=Xylophilus rhododendri TaxID=2697032 RepID=A0A857J488_9BURK|nr:7-carboxy-7-deazaguanine synthase [Xylophilus rhododendri]QHI97862.1 7-carboxy-7-deazaguanine synthase [Xylophilus rhododendri]
MVYTVKEIFYTLQGEGANAGRPAVFCRFAGCNLWNGREDGRTEAVCRFCDTDFVGTDGTLGGKFRQAQALAAQIAALWPAHDRAHRLVVLTGGEPLLQVDEALIAALHAEGFEIAVETNGSVAAPPGIDWLCVSPKAGAPWVQRQGQELKVVWPQEGLDLDALEAADFSHRFLQPMDDTARLGLSGGPHNLANTRTCIELCMARPAWRLSLQTHKVTGIR